MNKLLCGHFDTFNKGSRCYDCWKAETDRGELWDSKVVRCPKCGHYWEPDFESMHEDQWCSECDYMFEVTMNVTATWDSPSMLESSGVK